MLPIPGTRNMAHMEENHAAACVRLTAEQVAQLDVAFAPERAVGPRYSGPGQASVTTEMFDFEKRQHGG